MGEGTRPDNTPPWPAGGRGTPAWGGWRGWRSPRCPVRRCSRRPGVRCPSRRGRRGPTTAGHTWGPRVGGAGREHGLTEQGTNRPSHGEFYRGRDIEWIHSALCVMKVSPKGISFREKKNVTLKVSTEIGMEHFTVPITFIEAFDLVRDGLAEGPLSLPRGEPLVGDPGLGCDPVCRWKVTGHRGDRRSGRRRSIQKL